MEIFDHNTEYGQIFCKICSDEKSKRQKYNYEHLLKSILVILNLIDDNEDPHIISYAPIKGPHKYTIYRTQTFS